MQGIKHFKYTSLMIGLLSSPTFTLAQDAALEIEEILVTADKLNTRSAINTPMAVSVIGGEDIERDGFTQTSELLPQTPGVLVDELYAGMSTVNIRGITSDGSGDPTVGFYLDDLPFALPPFNILPDINPYDLSHVEVLRGPQGTLYGASSMGGTVRVMTQKPEHNELSGKLTVGYSNTEKGDDNHRVQGAINLPLINDVMSARLVASQVKRDGYIDLPLSGKDNHNDYEDQSYRVKLLYTPTDTMEFGLSYWTVQQDTGMSYSDDDYNYSLAYLVFGFDFIPTGDIVPAPEERLNGSLEYDLANINATIELTDNYSVYGTISTIEVQQHISFQHLFPVPADIDNDYETVSGEVRLSFTNDDGLAWTVGGFYQDTDGDSEFSGTLRFATQPVTELDLLFADITRGSEQTAVFGEIHYYLIPETLEFTLGVRYFEDERFEADRPGTSTAAGLVAAGYDLRRKDDFSATTGRINLSYTPDEQSLYYLNISEGFRSGNVQAGASLLSGLAPLVSEPEELISYEVGGKFQLLDQALTLDIAAYYWEWDEIVLALGEILPDGTPASYFANVGKADAYGLDLGLSYTGIDGLTLSLVGNINESEYGDNLPRAGIEEGDSIVFTPGYSMTTTASYEWRLFEGLDGVIYASYTLNDATTAYRSGGQPLESDNIQNLNLRAGVTAKNWSVILSAANVLNDSDIKSQNGAFVTSNATSIYQRPRTIGLELNVKF